MKEPKIEIKLVGGNLEIRVEVETNEGTYIHKEIRPAPKQPNWDDWQKWLPPVQPALPNYPWWYGQPNGGHLGWRFTTSDKTYKNEE